VPHTMHRACSRVAVPTHTRTVLLVGSAPATRDYWSFPGSGSSEGLGAEAFSVGPRLEDSESLGESLRLEARGENLHPQSPGW
jgi:hypothetical protein